MDGSVKRVSRAVQEIEEYRFGVFATGGASAYQRAANAFQVGVEGDVVGGEEQEEDEEEEEGEAASLRVQSATCPVYVDMRI